MTGQGFFVMLGPPASGKGTQGRLLAEHLDIPYLSTGARLRREIEEGSDLGLRAKGFLDANQYVPDALAIELVECWIGRHSEGWMLDGFPRSIPQAEIFLKAHHAPTVIHLAVPVSELRKRVTTRRECIECGVTSTSDYQLCPKCGCAALEARADDSTEGFEKRFQAYQRFTVPTLEFLQARTKVVTVDGIGTPEEVAQTIAQQIN